MIEDDLIPVIITAKRAVNARKALDKIIENLQNDAAFHYCFLSAELSNKPNTDTVVKTLENLNGLSKKLSMPYLVKAALIYDEHLNDFEIQKSQGEYIRESELAGSLIDFVAEFNPALRLQKQNKIIYSGIDRKNIVITSMIHRFSESTIDFVNDNIESMLMLNDLDKKLEKREKERFKEYFKGLDT